MLWDLIVGENSNENPRRTSFSIGQIEISALGVALANSVLFALLNLRDYARTIYESCEACKKSLDLAKY